MAASFTMQYQVGDAIRTLRVVEAALEDPSDLMKDVLLVLIRSTQLNFEQQGRPESWAPHALSTLLARMRKANKGRASNRGKDRILGAIGSFTALILRDTGLLMQSLGAGASGAFDAADGFGESDETSAILGTNRPGADALQLGNPANNLPAREYVLMQEQDEEDITQMAMDFVMQVGPYAKT